MLLSCYTYMIIIIKGMMNKAIGHDELYKMGFDGASIGQLRKLSPSQYARLLVILEEFQKEKKRKT